MCATTKIEKEFSPPDGGTRAWLIMVGAFLCNGILFGVVNSYSVFYEDIYKTLKAQNVTDASSKTALVGSLTVGTTFLLSSAAGVLTDLVGIQQTTAIGGILAASGMLLSSFYSHSVETLYVTYGCMFGIGGALTYTPSLAILGHYFKKYLGVVNGVVTAGSSVFTVVMPLLLDCVIKRSGLAAALRMVAGLASCIILAAFLFKPAPALRRQKATTLREAFNVSIWRNKKYLIWALLVPISLTGYFVPYVHIISFVHDYFPNNDGKLPVICIGITSGIGRLIFGYIADLPKVNRILLQQISFLVIGLVTILLPSMTSFPWLLLLCLFMGLFDGCFVSLIGPIAFDLCGQNSAAQGIGFLLGLCSIPLTIGPFFAGKLYDSLGSYDIPFKLAGIPPIVGAILLCSIRLIKKPAQQPKLTPYDLSNQPLALLTQENSYKEDQKVRSIQAKLASAESLNDRDEAEGKGDPAANALIV